MQRSSKNDKRQHWSTIILCTVVGHLCNLVKFINRGPHDLPALAVLHVGVGSSLEQSLCDSCHAAHHFCRVFLGTERTDQVKWGFYRPHCGCIHLSRVANQEDGGKFITWKNREKVMKKDFLLSYINFKLEMERVIFHTKCLLNNLITWVSW